jgi:hypothetical protein
MIPICIEIQGFLLLILAQTRRGEGRLVKKVKIMAGDGSRGGNPILEPVG